MTTVYTIPAEMSFVDALASGLMQQAADEPFELADFTVLLPTRRAVRSLREAFLRLSGGAPTLLPRMTPLGDLDEDELVIAGWEEMATVGLTGDVPPAISSLRRQLLLTRLVQQFIGAQSTAGNTAVDQAARLSGGLARLLDQVQTENLSFENLASLVPEEYAHHWQTTLDFLKILTEHWPNILAAQKAIDPAQRRNLLLQAQAEVWRNQPPAAPVIAAGSTGSIPATAGLLKIIADVPLGAVVLPGFDLSLDEETRAGLDQTHAQHGMKVLLDRLEINPADVQLWPCPGIDEAPRVRSGRARLLRDALLPASAVDTWRQLPPPPDEALEGLRRVDCPGPDEEAGVIALMLREVLESEGKSAALVTPDRKLARRVAAEMNRWGIEIDDTAGVPLAQTPPGSFLKLAVDLVAGGFAPLQFLAIGKHPLTAAGRPVAAFRRFVRELEMSVLRGPRPAPGIDGLLAGLQDETRHLKPVLLDLEVMAADLSELLNRPSVSLIELVGAHISFAEALAASEDMPGPARLWAGEAGEAAAGFISELLDSAASLGDLSGASYGSLFDVLMTGRAVRPRYGGHPRLAIWGLLEARLQHAELIILGGLNEGTWPPEAPSDPWMSRPMRGAFGLPLPERRIGLSAHDFQQAFCAPEVVITRARRVEGTPTVPSRWLLRLEKFLIGMGAGEQLQMQGPWLHWQGLLDRPERIVPASPPAPTPPIEARPRQLSVTQIETWMRDPYAIYARHILGLRALPELDALPDAADYGSIIHEALDAFSRAYPGPMPDKAENKLLALGRDRFAAVLNHPGVWAFWWPRFERIAAWFVDLERDRRGEIAATHSEVAGGTKLNEDAQSFKLTAKADRIDELADGGLRIIDYKTGAPPTKTEVAAGFAPQLPLEAVIAEDGGFAGLAGRPVTALDFWRLKGGTPAGEIISAGNDIADLARQAKAGLTALIRAFDRKDTPYEARPRPDQAPKYSDYEHLARVKEWAAAEGGED